MKKHGSRQRMRDERDKRIAGVTGSPTAVELSGVLRRRRLVPIDTASTTNSKYSYSNMMH
jgi:hypothetical protein